MRTAFIETLVEIAERDPRVMLLTADLGYSVLERFAQQFPDRYLNVGVAEQNMVGVATGLAEAGRIPFVYSIATFATLRPFEFIRNGPIAHNLRVRVVGIGGGFEYGHNGLSHFALEDIAMMRTQPSMAVFAPADAAQARNGLLATWEREGPAYYRLGKNDHASIPALNGNFAVGHAQLLGSESEFLLIATGAASVNAAAALDELTADSIPARLIIVDQFNTGELEGIREALRRAKFAVTLESHYVNGGLGSYVAELIAEEGLACRIVRRGVTSTPAGICGSERYMNERYGMLPQQIASVVRDEYRKHSR